MKRFFALLISTIILMSCASAEIFAAEQMPLKIYPLYEGTEENRAHVLHGEAKQNYFGQKFTVPSGNYLTGISLSVATYVDGNVNHGTFKVYKWRRDYSTTVSAPPIFSADIVNHVDNATINIPIPFSLGAEGNLYYEMTYLEGNAVYSPYMTTNPPVEGTEIYLAGERVTPEGQTISARLTICDKDYIPPETNSPFDTTAPDDTEGAEDSSVVVPTVTEETPSDSMHNGGANGTSNPDAPDQNGAVDNEGNGDASDDNGEPSPDEAKDETAASSGCKSSVGAASAVILLATMGACYKKRKLYNN